MYKAAIREFTRRRPFEPFRIQVSDGTTYDVRHPDMAAASDTTVAICVPWEGQQDKERTHIIALEHIVKLLPVPVAAKESA